MAINSVSTRDLYYMDLNLVHRRLYLSDKCRLVNTLPQKRLYSSCGCFYNRCPFIHFNVFCNDCDFSYDILDL